MSIAVAIVATMALGSVTAHAAVVIQEAFDPVSGEGEFTVINNSLTDIFAFAVRNDSADDAFLEPGDRLDAWEALLVSKEQWDADDLNAYAPSIPDSEQRDFTALFRNLILIDKANAIETCRKPSFLAICGCNDTIRGSNFPPIGIFLQPRFSSLFSFSG